MRSGVGKDVAELNSEPGGLKEVPGLSATPCYNPVSPPCEEIDDEICGENTYKGFAPPIIRRKAEAWNARRGINGIIGKFFEREQVDKRLRPV